MKEPEMINLGIGEVHVATESSVISTILGSCVSVCLYSKKHKVGGIIHFALPDRKHARNSDRSDLNFGDEAIRTLLRKILSISGINVSDLAAKIVGGGSVVSELSHSISIGDLNIEVARDALKRAGIKVEGEDVGGDCGRKIFFYSDTGRLRVSKLGGKKDLKTSSKVIKVLIVDDSKTIREVFSRILKSDGVEIIGKASDAKEAMECIKKQRPDVITLDINMPGMDGITFLKKYLPLYPIPTVLISSININEGHQVMHGLESGAVDYIQKPSLHEITTQTDLIREKIITAASIKVDPNKAKISAIKKLGPQENYKGKKVVAIGASTGGTEAIKEVLLGLPDQIPPIVIVQHIPPVFSTAFSKRLNELCKFEVLEAKDGDEVIPNRVLIAPGGLQMELVLKNGKRIVHVYEGERVNRHMPSVDVLFNSVAKNLGPDSLGVILTGMGNDGAAGMLQMKRSGAHTIGQDEASCVVYGMPKAAYQLGGVIQVCPLNLVASNIIQALGKARVA